MGVSVGVAVSFGRGVAVAATGPPGLPGMAVAVGVIVGMTGVVVEDVCCPWLFTLAGVAV